MFVLLLLGHHGGCLIELENTKKHICLISLFNIRCIWDRQRFYNLLIFKNFYESIKKCINP